MDRNNHAVVGEADTAEQPADMQASYNGKGILEVLEVIRTIGDAGVPCCIVGGHALKYYGVPRAACEWLVCVPADRSDEVAAMFSKEPLSDVYEPSSRPVLPQVRSLLHTYPLFKMKGVQFSFWIVPSSEYFVADLDPSQFERSPLDVPYPKLEFFAQGLLDTQKWGELQELIDGMDLSEEWGEENLDLDKPGEVEYAKRKNEHIRGSLENHPNSVIPSTLSEKPVDLRKIWLKNVRNKERRTPFLAPKGKYRTKYRKTGEPDPRLMEGRIC